MSALRDALDALPESVFVDLLESRDAYLFSIDLPGVSSETVDVRAETDCLHIEARREKETPEGFQYRTEERSLFLDVELPLPPRAAVAQTDARIERGVLTLHIPKTTTETSISVESR